MVVLRVVFLFLFLLLVFPFLLLPCVVDCQSGYVQQGLTWNSQYQSGLSPAPWIGRYGASSAVTSAGGILLIGGVVYTNSTTFTLLNDVQQSMNDGSTFQPSVTAPFTPRFFHASALTSAGSILMIGGLTYGSGSLVPSLLADTWYTNDGVVWSQGSQMPWSIGRCAHAVSADTLSLIFYVTGGYTIGPPQVLNDVWKTPDAGNTWQIATINAPWAARAWHGLLVRQGTLFVVGGAQYMGGIAWTAVNDVWTSVDQGTTWMQLTPVVPFAGRYQCTIISYNNDDLFAIGGVTVPATIQYLYIPPSISPSVTVYSDVWESTDAGMSWLQTNPTSVFGPRYSSPGIILNQDLTLIGGVGVNMTYFNDVWNTVLPLDSTSQSATILAAIIGSLSGVLMILVVVMRRLQTKFATVPPGGHVVVSGKTEAQLKQQVQAETETTDSAVELQQQEPDEDQLYDEHEDGHQQEEL